ncbi:MAG: universal stress protein [Sphaerochaetaceae bacterium]|jgi:nucleotide-binding universal stress UspA family protein
MKEPFKNILVYLDGSEESIVASMAAITLALRLDAHLTAMYVVNTKALQELVKARIFLEFEEQEYRRDIEGDARRYLDHVEKMAIQKGVSCTLEKRSGTVQTEVRQYVQDHDVDILVLGGLSQIHSRRDELMNEADRIMRSATCPVLVVRDNDDIWDTFESLPNVPVGGESDDT